MFKRGSVVCVVAGLVLTAAGSANAAVTISEDLASPPNAGPNGWTPVDNSDTIAPFSGRSDADGGKLIINTLGENVGISYSQSNSAPHTGVQWVNAEMIANISQSESTDPGSDGMGVAVGVGNSTFQYAMGLRVADVGGGNFDVTVVVFNRIGGGPPSVAGTYTFTDAGINQHRYNAEWNGTNLNVYVDAFQGDVPDLVVGGGNFLASAAPLLMFGDIRSTPRAVGNIYNVRFSDGDTLLPVPEPATFALALVGGAAMLLRRKP